jgi:hypothetical protein
MSRFEKYLARLVACPRDYEWRELCVVLKVLGFVEQKGSGAAVAFRHSENKEHVIHLHKPHGRNPPTVLVVYLKTVVVKLREWGLIDG